MLLGGCQATVADPRADGGMELRLLASPRGARVLRGRTRGPWDAADTGSFWKRGAVQETCARSMDKATAFRFALGERARVKAKRSPTPVQANRVVHDEMSNWRSRSPAWRRKNRGQLLAWSGIWVAHCGLNPSTDLTPGSGRGTTWAGKNCEKPWS